MYDKESLAKINQIYLSEHYRLKDEDVAMVNQWVARIESSRDETRPMAGDIVRYTNEYSEYYHHAHIEKINQGKAVVCEQPHVSYVSFSDTEQAVTYFSGGGAWTTLHVDELKYIGKEEKLFQDFGSCGGCGACAHGAILFKADVNVWEYTTKNLRYGAYTTKDWALDYISYCAKDPDGSPYHYFGHCRAFIKESDYLEWLITYKGVEFEGGSPTQRVVFYYRKQESLISKEEWDALKLPTDTRPMNLSVVPVKYRYDDTAHIIYEYRFTNSGSRNGDAGHPYRMARELLQSGTYKREIHPQTEGALRE